MTTHAELYRCAYSAGLPEKHPVHVQVRIKGASICAQVVEMFMIESTEWVKLENRSLGQFSRPCKVVRACEGCDDGHMCVCSNASSI